MRRHTAAFTVIELLVAAAVTVVLAGILILVTRGALEAWKRTESGLSENAQVKLVFDLLERDLQAAIPSTGTEPRMAAGIANNIGILSNHGWTQSARVKPAGAISQLYLSDILLDSGRKIGRARFGLSGVWLRLITTNAESNGSLPSAISYQIARRPVTGAVANDNNLSMRYTLFRSAVSTANTFISGYDLQTLDYTSSAAQPASTRSASTLMNPNNSDALCANVVDFGVWFYQRLTNGDTLRLFPTVASGDVSFSAIGSVSNAQSSTYPDFVDVMVRILSEEGAAQLESLEQGRITPPASYTYDEWWWTIVETNSTVYVQRIKVGEAEP